MKKEFNKETLKAFRSDFDKAMEEISKKYGVTVGLGNISYTANKFTSKITVNRVEAVNGVPVKIISDFTNNIANSIVEQAGISFNGKNFIGTSWNYNGCKVVVTGYNSDKPKNCWELEVDGRAANTGTNFFKSVMQINS